MHFTRITFNKINFLLGRNPVIEKRKDWRLFIPKPYKTVMILSADFELAWAWQWAKENDPLKLAYSKAAMARKNTPKILTLCDKYNIPITWATVGHLFLESCSKEKGWGHQDIPRIKNFENEYWRFDGNDWFVHDPATNYKESPNWYAPDLIHQIINSETKHEIGCHTFSHIDCRDKLCPDEVFLAEIKECKRLAQKFSVDLKSFVHPAHTIGHLDDIEAFGFTNYRTNYRNALGFPKKHANGLWEIEQTAEILYRADWRIDYHIKRYKKIIDRALKSNTLCYFWFHPSMDSIVVDKVLPEIFDYISSKREDIWITTSKDYVDFLNNQHEK